MKGVFFKHPLEFRLELTGNEWRQGEKLACQLSLNNRGNVPFSVTAPFLLLARADIKRVREKSADAFAIISSSQLASSLELEAGHEQGFSSAFELDTNCIISDNKQSLYLLCGAGSLAELAGHLAINVIPHLHIEALLSVMENSFSFSLKSQKSKQDFVEAKLKPPAGGEFPSLAQLVLNCQITEDKLVVKYIFHLKTLQADALSLKIGKAKREIVQELEFKQYLFPTGQVQHESLEKAIAEALSVIKSH